MNTNLQHSEEFTRSKVCNNNAFSVPKNYFDGIENNIITEISLGELPKKVNFEAPIDYFTNYRGKYKSKN